MEISHRLLLFLLFIFIILGLLAIIIWLAVTSKSSSSSSSFSSFNPFLKAYDVETGLLQLDSTVTGPTGSISLQTGFFTILQTTIDTTNNLHTGIDHLVCTVSAFTSIGTSDEIVSTGLAASSVEIASVEMQVLVDGQLANPGIVTFDNVTHIFEPTINTTQLLENIIIRGCSHAFTFVYPNTTSLATGGVHTIVAQARLTTVATSNLFTLVEATAIVGNRSLVVVPGCTFSSSSSSSSSSSNSSSTATSSSSSSSSSK